MPERSLPEQTLSPVKRALAEIRALRARVQELESHSVTGASYAPIAIVGAGLRFPGGVEDEDSFWSLLEQGRDAITEIPQDRWDRHEYYNANPDAPGAMYTRHGGFLPQVDRFDAGFFGISPREAVAMDPQHRLALEVAWEALENAGCSPAALQASATGVFLGIANQDYARIALSRPDTIDAYTGSGNSPAMAAGRLSYVLGLHGPSMVVDTSCSSSLVVVHLACQSLHAGECTTALAGGVNLILLPESNIALSKAHMMARDGHCKTFAEGADGYVRSEGCGIVVLKKLADAQACGDRVLAVIRGSAVNHDGRSGGLTAPNGPAQAAVIRKALETAGIAPGEIGYVEAHGTGTSLGDPIEVETLAGVLNQERPADAPLCIGSVKTNIGHAEAASGIAGLLKTVLVLRHKKIPASLHLEHRNPLIPWDRLRMEVPTRTTDWTPENRRRYAGVSSFGFSGTNAHVIVEEAPPVPQPANSPDRPLHVLALSAKTPAALDRLREKYIALFRVSTDADLPNICFTANTGRAHFDFRIAAVAGTVKEMIAALERTVPVDVRMPIPGVLAGSSRGARQTPDTPWENDWRQTLQSLALQYMRREAVDWAALDKGYVRTKLALPTYPFQRERYWLESVPGDLSLQIWTHASEAAVSQSRQAPIDVRVESFAEKWKVLERIAIGEMLQTLRTLGAYTAAGESRDAHSLCALCGIVPAHVRLMSRWLHRLAAAGYVEENGGRFVGAAPLPQPDLASLWRNAEQLCSDEPYVLEYLRNCSRNLPDVLRGNTSAIETLFPGGSPVLARNLYENSGGSRYANKIVAAAVRAACAEIPSSRRVRIVELGGGTGATTAGILPELPSDRVVYRFTDVSEVFLDRARERFAGFSFVQYGLLDIEDDAQMAAQAGGCNIVIAANVVHATRDLEATLARIAHLLLPGGTLILLETTKEPAWHDISTGLIEGWQKSSDAARDSHTLLSASQWEQMLRHAGLQAVVRVPEPGSIAEEIGLHVLLARGPVASNMDRSPIDPATVTVEPWSQGATRPQEKSSPDKTALATLKTAMPAEKHAIVLRLVREEVAQVLRLPAGALPGKSDRLMEIGMDSLMAVELKDNLASSFGVETIPSTLIFDFPTADSIAAYLLAQLSSDPVSSQENGAPAPASNRALHAAEIDEMQDEEVAQLLRSYLDK